MSYSPKICLMLCCVLVLAVAGAQTVHRPAPSDQPAKVAQAAPAQAGNDDKLDEEESEDLAPAALEMDKSGDSPLIRKLYEATRETKEKNILDRLEEAQKLIESGADVKPVDGLGRTALHWAVFGSSYATQPSVITEYEEIAHELIDHGIEINREDTYNDTALDYLLYS